MGLILDTSEVISGERLGLMPREVLTRLQSSVGSQDLGISVISVMELEHGIWRTASTAQALKRQEFLNVFFASVPIYPVTVPIAKRAARIDAGLRNGGLVIGVSDLLIGATELE